MLSINGVQFTKGENARAALNGVLSVKNTAQSGKVVVQLRMTVNGQPEAMIFSQTVAAGDNANPFFLCDASITAGQTYNYTLQVAVIGSGTISVRAGTFNIAAFRPVAIPPG